MVHVLVKQKVKDYNTWLGGFNGHNDARKSAGQIKGSVYANPKDNNEVFILFEWDNIENMHNFMNSDELKSVMKEFSASPPEVTVMEKKSDFN